MQKLNISNTFWGSLQMDLGAQPEMVWILLQGPSKNLQKKLTNSAF